MAMTPEELRIRISAENDSKQAFDSVNKDLKRTSTSAASTQKAVMGATRGFSGMGRSAGQAGIQIQQLVGQIQGGTNPMLALSQQTADLGFVLGAPLLGAVGGLAASLAMVLLPALFDTEDATSKLKDRIEELETAFSDLTAEQQRSYIRGVQQEINDLESASASLRQEIYDTKNGFMAMFDSQEEIDQKVEELTAQLQLNEQQIDKVKASLQGYVSGAEETEESTRRLTSSFETLEDQMRKLDALYIKFETPRERLIRQYKEADDVLAKYAGTEDLHARMTAKALEEYKKTLPTHEQVKETTKELAGATEDLNWEYQNIADNGISALEDGLTGLINGTKSAKDAFRSMALSIVNDMIKMQIQQSITSKLGGIFSSFFGGGGMTAASSGVGVGTAANPMAGLSIGSVSSFAGGGYTGSGSRSGGVDGQGGFPAILHPNETVVDHTQGQTGGVTINQTINVSTGVQQTVRTEIASLMPQIAAASKQAVLDARKRGGSFGAAFGA